MPLALAYIMIVCTALYLIQRVAGMTDPLHVGLAMFGLNLLLGLLVFGFLDSNVFIRGSGRQRHALHQRARRVTVPG
jgi:hypothetical protein